MRREERFADIALISIIVFAGCVSNQVKARVLDVTAEVLSAGSEADPIRKASMPAAVGMHVASWILRLVAQYLRDKK